MERITVEEGAVQDAINRVNLKMLSRLEEKGRGTLASSHEILGVLEEEMHELREAVRDKKQIDIRNELVDIAVGATFAVACMEAGGTDW